MSKHHSQRAYRTELDGLRALAVLAVLANHANSAWLEGGFLGVDSFFVLSGYVVARSSATRQNESKGEFYQRRLRRLQPALVLMLLSSCLLSWPVGLLTSSNLQTGLFSLVGLSNLNLLSQSLDYFGASATENPFTHTWSLGVEEQFYLLFPFIISRPRWLFALTPAAFGLWISLQLEHPENAFYLMPARFWELGLGILLWRWNSRWQAKPWIGGVGLAALLGAFFMPLGWQLWSTPLAVAGSSAMILGLNQTSRLKTFFSGTVVAAIGKRTYGIYLWHWPLLVIARSLWPADPWRNSLLPLIATILIAWASYRWLEQPLRQAKWGFRIGLSGIALAAGFMIGIRELATHGLLKVSYEQFSIPHKQKLATQNCHSSTRTDALLQCLPTASGDDPAKLVLIGDSHAAHLRPILADLGAPLIQLTDRNLPNLWLGRRCREAAYCFSVERFNKALEASLSHGSLVVLGLSPRRLTGPQRSPAQTNHAADHLRQSLNKLIPLLERRGSKLLLIEGLPQVNCPTGQTFASLFNRGGPGAVINTCSPSQNWIRTQNDVQIQVFEKLRQLHPSRVLIFRAKSYICNENPCHLGNDSKELFVWDELAHLTPTGLSRLEAPLQRTIQALLSSGVNSRL